jgi:purine-binding chemotaxis protein CheW
MTPCEDPSAAMSVVIDHKGELYSLLVDDVGDVLAPSTKGIERIPSNISSPSRDVCSGVYRLPDEILLVLEVDRLFRLIDKDIR